MTRKLDGEERVLWARVVASVKPLHREAGTSMPPPRSEVPVRASALSRNLSQTISPVRSKLPMAPGDTLDSTWDRRLARGAVRPDLVVDLHERNLDASYWLLDRRLEGAVVSGARVVLLITGKPPKDGQRTAGRGAIRASVADWLAASRHAARIAAVRPAHPRHGGAGALYIVLRRSRISHRQVS